MNARSTAGAQIAACFMSCDWIELCDIEISISKFLRRVSLPLCLRSSLFRLQSRVRAVCRLGPRVVSNIRINWHFIAIRNVSVTSSSGFTASLMKTNVECEEKSESNRPTLDQPSHVFAVCHAIIIAVTPESIGINWTQDALYDRWHDFWPDPPGDSSISIHYVCSGGLIGIHINYKIISCLPMLQCIVCIHNRNERKKAINNSCSSHCIRFDSVHLIGFDFIHEISGVLVHFLSDGRWNNGTVVHK